MAYLGNQLTITGTQNNKRLSTTATASQTNFTVAGGYAINQIDVYRNGVKLNNQNDFTASDGSTVVLTQGATGGDVIEFVIYENFDVADVINTTGNQTIDGNLTVVDLTARHINSSGFTTATQFVGNITGTAATFTGNVTVGGTLTYDDVTNIDSIGLITARNGLQVTGGIVTVTGQTNLANVSVSAAATVSGRFVPVDTRLASIADKTTVVDGNTISLSYSTGGGNVAICTNPSGAITLNVTDIPTSSDFDNRAISFAVIVKQGSTAYACTDVTLNGVSYGARATAGVATHIAYSSGTVATGNTSAYDIFNFTGINTSVVGSASTTANYKIISNVNGNYTLY